MRTQVDNVCSDTTCQQEVSADRRSETTALLKHKGRYFLIDSTSPLLICRLDSFVLWLTCLAVRARLSIRQSASTLLPISYRKQQTIFGRLTGLAGGEQQHMWDHWQLCATLRLLQSLTAKQQLNNFKKRIKIPYQVQVSGLSPTCALHNRPQACRNGQLRSACL